MRWMNGKMYERYMEGIDRHLDTESINDTWSGFPGCTAATLNLHRISMCSIIALFNHL